MKLYYDFHIHTSLSPCGDEDMTPNNIINMAKVKGLDAIAITDHNSCENVHACLEVGYKNNIIVIPGIELQTCEDIHVICLFKDEKVANEFQEWVYSKLPNFKYNKEMFGEQIIYDEFDNVIGKNERFLLGATGISLIEAYDRAKELQGVFIPAHVDRQSYSIITSLGFVPSTPKINFLEYNDINKLNKLIGMGLIDKNRYFFIKSSDAHYLGNIAEKSEYIVVEDISINSIFKSLLGLATINN